MKVYRIQYEVAWNTGDGREFDDGLCDGVYATRECAVAHMPKNRYEGWKSVKYSVTEQEVIEK